MQLHCPYCGERPFTEFSYLGDASVERPDSTGADNTEAIYEAVYLRENPAGEHRELCYHAFGCRSWLVVTRNTRTHDILNIRFASETLSDTG